MFSEWRLNDEILHHERVESEWLSCMQHRSLRDGGMTQQSRGLGALAENLDSLPRTLVRWHTPTCNSFSWWSNTLFWTLQFPALIFLYTGTQTYTYTHKVKKINIHRNKIGVLHKIEKDLEPWCRTYMTYLGKLS